MWGYYILRDRLPFFTLLLYAAPHIPQLRHLKPHADLAAQLIIATTTALTMLMGYAMIRGYPIQNVFYALLGVPNTWIYPAVIEWGTFITTAYIITAKKLKDHTLAANLAIQAASAGGWLYEIPIFIYWGSPILRFNDHNVFSLSFQIISLPILLITLIAYEWEPRNTATTSTLLYCAYLLLSTIFVDKRMALTGILGKWWHRLPTILMLYTWLLALPTKNGGIP